MVLASIWGKQSKRDIPRGSTVVDAAINGGGAELAVLAATVGCGAA